MSGGADQLALGLPGELVVDNFAGGGGASVGIERGIGRPVDVAINHDAAAVAMHRANHPDTEHYCTSVFKVDPRRATAGQPVGLAWFSPDCTHFSKAKGGRPVSRGIRGLAWVVIRWARRVRPRVIMLENVEEFLEWGPLGDDGRPDPERKGADFERWKGELERSGYRVEYRMLRACDYGAPTIRRRLFVIARRDGLPIRWPEPTHGEGQGRAPYRTAAECIDWSQPCPSIFERKRPLADKTLQRIARGIQRFVVEAEDPFVVRTDQHKSNSGCTYSLRQPLTTITSANGHALVAPYLAGVGGRMGQSRPRGMQEPVQTVTSKADTVLMAPFLAPRYGERPTQDPRTQPVTEPLATVTATNNGGRLAAAFLAKHYGGVVGTGLRNPAATVTARDHHALVTSNLVKLRGTCRDGQDLREPAPTVTAGGQHVGEVRAFLQKYYGTGGQHQDCRDPLHTIPSKARFGLVEVAGEPYQIVDIGMRMLTPRELYRAQGFPDWYEIAPEVDGKPLTKTEQVAKVGNSVPPQLVEVLVAANFQHERASDSGAA